MKKSSLLILILLIMISLVSCTFTPQEKPNDGPSINVTEPNEEVNEDIDSVPTEIIPSTDYNIIYTSGSKNVFTITDNTIIFSEITEDSVYQITGSLDGNIVIDLKNDFKLTLEFVDFTLTSSSINPITILSGSKVELKAKKDTINYIYDYRDTVDSSNEELFSATIYSLIDLELSGKGKLEVFSKNNNGIHTKDDLEVKNLTLNVNCKDNALKGNDSVTIESGNVNLVAKVGDGIKTTNSHINDNENQKGYINILGGTINIYAACDGIDSSYDVLIENAELNIYTDKYSGYSDNVTESPSESIYYIRTSSGSYRYSVKYYNSETNEEVWYNAKATSSSGRYYYYEVTKPEGYNKLILYVYSSNQTQGQEGSYYKKFDMTVNNNYDTMAISSRWSCDWTKYSSENNFGGGGFPGGGFNEGNSDKGTYSTKGIKADNQISINSGTIKVNSYDDSIHASSGVSLENGKTSLGNVVINGGDLTLYSNDDGIHADNILTINDGNIQVTNSYEGLEGNIVSITGGSIGIISKDDGINATATSGTSITLSGGMIYIYAGGDGIDSNSRASYEGIAFKGSDVVVISNSGGNSAIDSEKGYLYSKGKVIAIMPSGGMSNETINCSNFNSVGTKKTNVSLTSGIYLEISVSNSLVCSVKMPVSISNAMVVYLGSSSASISTTTNSSYTYNSNGVYFK